MMSEIGAIVPIRRDEAGRVVMLDQTRLPNEEIYHAYERAEQVADAITTMVIRGAPAIGVAAAMGLALGARQLDRDDFLSGFSGLCTQMAQTRPTPALSHAAPARGPTATPTRPAPAPARTSPSRRRRGCSPPRR